MGKRKKRKTRRMPPLSVVDKLIYWLLLALILGVCSCLLFAPLLLWKRIAFRDPMVAAAVAHTSVLWLFPGLFTFACVSIAAWSWKFQGNKAIFGKRNYRYGQGEYPLFMRNKPKSPAEEKKKHTRRTIAVFLLCLVLVSFLTYPLSFCGRDSLHWDGSFISYDMFNKATEEYSAREVSSVKLDCCRQKTERYIWGRMTVYMAITFEDGKAIRFYAEDYEKAYYGQPQNWLVGMTRVLENYDPAIVTYAHKASLPQVIRDWKLDAEEADMLYALFGQT